MSKHVKELQRQYLDRQFAGSDDLLVVNVVGMDAISNHKLRMEFRKKGISMQVVKNSLARSTLVKKGISGVDGPLSGPAALVWGGAGIVELAREVVDWSKKFQKFEVKGGYVSGQAIAAAQVTALSQMPSRVELLGQIVAMALSPASNVSAAANGPGQRLVAQLRSMAEKEEASPAAAPASA